MKRQNPPIGQRKAPRDHHLATPRSKRPIRHRSLRRRARASCFPVSSRSISCREARVFFSPFKAIFTDQLCQSFLKSSEKLHGWRKIDGSFSSEGNQASRSTHWGDQDHTTGSGTLLLGTPSYRRGEGPVTFHLNLNFPHVKNQHSFQQLTWKVKRVC